MSQGLCRSIAFRNATVRTANSQAHLITIEWELRGWALESWVITNLTGDSNPCSSVRTMPYKQVSKGSRWEEPGFLSGVRTCESTPDRIRGLQPVQSHWALSLEGPHDWFSALLSRLEI